MDRQEMQHRTKQFALRIIHLFQALPNSQCAYIIGKQLLRSGTSVGANYRAACRGRSSAEFVAKLGICLEEADETQYWLELFIESGIIPEEKLRPLLDEAGQLTAILFSAIKTAKMNSHKS